MATPAAEQYLTFEEQKAAMIVGLCITAVVCMSYFMYIWYLRSAQALEEAAAAAAAADSSDIDGGGVEGRPNYTIDFQAALEKYPPEVYTPAATGTGAGLKECPVCLGCFVPGDVIRSLPKEHTFHARCIDDWLSQHSTCPLCRESIV